MYHPRNLEFFYCSRYYNVSGSSKLHFLLNYIKNMLVLQCHLFLEAGIGFLAEAGMTLFWPGSDRSGILYRARIIGKNRRKTKGCHDNVWVSEKCSILSIKIHCIILLKILAKTRISVLISRPSWDPGQFLPTSSSKLNRLL